MASGQVRAPCAPAISRGSEDEDAFLDARESGSIPILQRIFRAGNKDVGAGPASVESSLYFSAAREAAATYCFVEAT
jgi:hypothetical protein